jgi:hypothetical protein
MNSSSEDMSRSLGPDFMDAVIRSAIAMASAENRKAMWITVCQISTFSL